MKNKINLVINKILIIILGVLIGYTIEMIFSYNKEKEEKEFYEKYQDLLQKEELID